MQLNDYIQYSFFVIMKSKGKMNMKTEQNTRQEGVRQNNKQKVRARVHQKVKRWKQDIKDEMQLGDAQFGFVPSIITVLAMMLGIHAMRFIFVADIDKAMAFIVAAGILDLLDGKVARLLKVSSKFGGTLDTLADFLNFGVAPGFALYMNYSYAIDAKIYWIAVVLYIVCLGLRLARFSVVGIEGEKFFRGVPAPGAAYMLTLPICLQKAQVGICHTSCAYLSLALLLMTSWLMVSRIQTVALGRLRFAKKHYPLLVVALAIMLCLLYEHTWYLLLSIHVVYFMSILRGAMKRKSIDNAR